MVGHELIGFIIDGNGLKAISCMTIGPEDLVIRLIEGTKWAADMDVQGGV
jgi:hypothetical protein